MKKSRLLGAVFVWLSFIFTSVAHAILIDVNYTGTVNGSSTDFGFGTEIIFEGTYDTDDVNAAGDAVIFQSSSLSIGGVAQTGVSASTGENQPGRGEVFVQWDGPPLNPDLSIVFDFSTVFPDLTGLTISDLVDIEINHDGELPDPVLTTAFSVTAVPVPAAAWLFGSGLLGLIGISRRKKAA